MPDTPSAALTRCTRFDSESERGRRNGGKAKARLGDGGTGDVVRKLIAEHPVPGFGHMDTCIEKLRNFGAEIGYGLDICIPPRPGGFLEPPPGSRLDFVLKHGPTGCGV